MNSWNEAGRVWEEDHGLLDAEQVALCDRADVAEPLRSPIPTRMISNGEYMPVPQTEQQRRVEARVEELATSASDKLGISRRAFLRSSGGMASRASGSWMSCSLTRSHGRGLGVQRSATNASLRW